MAASALNVRELVVYITFNPYMMNRLVQSMNPRTDKMQIKSCRRVALILATPRFVIKPIALFALIWIFLIFCTNCTNLPVKADTPQVPTLDDVLIVADEWEGPIDPHQFKDWIVVSHSPCPGGAPDYHILLANPDKTMTVEIVVMPSQEEERIILIRYRYFIDKIEYIFGLTRANTNKYSRIGGGTA